MSRGAIIAGVLAMAGRLSLLASATLLLVSGGLEAQTFQGRVLEEDTEAPVATSLVSLLDEEGGQVGVSIADSTGAYRVRAPRPGIYRLRAERIGFATFETPLLEVGNEDGVYPVDLVLSTDPYELPGFTVETNRLSDEEADRQIRLILGVSIPSLRYRPIGYETVQQSVDRAHRLEDLLRSVGLPGLIVTYQRDGPCFSLRARGCLPVYLNGLRLRREFVETVPLESIYRIVVVTPTDGSLTYPAGGVLLYTEAWLG